MYSYSPISKLKVKNFRNIGDAELDFSESPIITLVGENEAGKTSIIKAFGACALHSSPREQKDWVRDGTKMFGVEIDLQDGTQVVRVKENGGINMYRVIRADGTVWDTNKITDGLPMEVQNVMGLIEEPETGEYLHIRTYEDKLLFVVTPNSVNYKVMYNALKVEQLTKAIKSGSSEVNSLKSTINSNDASMVTLQAQLRGMKIVDVEPLTNCKDRLISQLAALDKLEHAKILADKVNMCERQLGALGLLDRFNLQSVNEMLASNLSNTSRLLNSKNELENCRSRLNDIDSIVEIDTNVVSKLQNLMDKKQVLNSKINDAGALVHISEIAEIPEAIVLHMIRAEELLNESKSLSKQIATVDLSECSEITQSNINSIDKLDKVSTLSKSVYAKKIELEQATTYIGQVQDYLKQCGVAVESCPKCGEAVIFDIDKIEQGGN